MIVYDDTMAMSAAVDKDKSREDFKLGGFFMANYYCEYCGQKYSSVQSLTGYSCPRHPDGANKGRHKLYEGSEKSQYVCKYCGQKYSSIQSLTGYSCPRHPNGANKGQHAPAL